MGKLVRNGISYTDPVVDGALDSTSKNPVQNKVVTAALNDKQNQIDEIESIIGNINTVLEEVL